MASTSCDDDWFCTYGKPEMEKKTKHTTVAEVHAVQNGWLVEDMEGNISVATTIKEVCALVKEATEEAEESLEEV